MAEAIFIYRARNEFSGLRFRFLRLLGVGMVANLNQNRTVSAVPSGAITHLITRGRRQRVCFMALLVATQ